MKEKFKKLISMLTTAAMVLICTAGLSVHAEDAVNQGGSGTADETQEESTAIIGTVRVVDDSRILIEKQFNDWGSSSALVCWVSMKNSQAFPEVKVGYQAKIIYDGTETVSGQIMEITADEIIPLFNKTSYIIGVVKEVYSKQILVSYKELFNGEFHEELGYISYTDSSKTMTEFEEGERVLIVYDGLIATTSPTQIRAYQICKVKENSNSDEDAIDLTADSELKDYNGINYFVTRVVSNGIVELNGSLCSLNTGNLSAGEEILVIPNMSITIDETNEEPTVVYQLMVLETYPCQIYTDFVYPLGTSSETGIKECHTATVTGTNPLKIQVDDWSYYPDCNYSLLEYKDAEKQFPDVKIGDKLFFECDKLYTEAEGVCFPLNVKAEYISLLKDANTAEKTEGVIVETDQTTVKVRVTDSVYDLKFIDNNYSTMDLGVGEKVEISYENYIDNGSMYAYKVLKTADAVNGDIDANGKADISDAIALMKFLKNQPGKTIINADINGDGKVNIFDANSLSRLLSVNKE